MKHAETFREFTRRKLLEGLRNMDEGNLPEPSDHPIKTPSYDSAIAWFEAHDQFRKALAEAKEVLDSAFKERMKSIRAVERRKRQTDSKRKKRRAIAFDKGISIRTRTNCANMTAEEKSEHKRRKEREKKRRQRANAAYASEWQV